MNLPNATQLKSQSQDLNSGRLDAEAKSISALLKVWILDQ